MYDPSKLPRSFAKSVADLFANVITDIVTNPEQTLQYLEASITNSPFTFSVTDIARTVILRAASQIEVPRNSIEDIQACTPTQSRKMEASVQRGSDGLDQYVFTVDNCISSTRLRESGDRVAEACPVLRTRIVNLEQHGTCQVTINTPPAWVEDSSLSEYTQWDRDCPVRYGRPLCRFGEVREQNGATYFILSLHHSLYDPWVIAKILNAFESACAGDPLQSAQSLPNRHRPFDWQKSVSSCASIARIPKACPEGLQFPRILSDTSSAYLSNSRSISLSRYTEADMIQAAWILCLSRLTGEDHICFGIYLTCRGTTHDSISGVAEPVGAVVPFSVDLSTLPTVESLLQSVHKSTDESTSLLNAQSVSKTYASSQGSHVAERCANVLFIDTSNISPLHPAPRVFKHIQTNRAIGSFGNANLVVSCILLPNDTRIDMQFDKETISPETVDILLEQYKHAIQQLVSNASSSLADLESLSDHEASLLQAWNRHIPTAAETCVHDQIRIIAEQNSRATAVCSWDYELDYGMLEDLSDRAAILMQKEGVTLGMPIPYFLEKSAVSIVVMLGILKAGGILLPLDIKYPSDRIACIISESRATKIVTSFNLLAKVNERIEAPRPIAVDMNLIQSLAPGRPTHVHIKPSDTCYIIYTSGSTGKPKGTVITHRNFSTSLKYRLDLVNMTPETRTLQYLNFIFDVSMFDIFLTLVAGGCVCMPSEYEWFNDISGAIRRTRSNFMFLTPSLATLLNPSEVPTLRTLGLTGESFERHIVEQWKHVRVLNLYGPAEATVHSSGCKVSSGSGKHHLNIGRPGGCLYWVVDPHDHNKLMSIGCPGELLIQGPIVSPGYLGNPTLTDTVFIKPPPWMNRFKIQDLSEHGCSLAEIKSSQRCYKTGDLAIQVSDGSVIYQGRKDTQVKLNGVRIELGEIEYHLRRVLKTTWVIAAELIKPSGQDQDGCLAVFFAPAGQEQSGVTNVPCKILPPVQKEAYALRSALAIALPVYMVPRFFVHLERLPLTSSGKTDRLRLRRTGATLSLRQLSIYDPVQEIPNGAMELQPPTRSGPDDDARDYPTSLEDELRRLWSETLAVPMEAINIADDFFNIGGSSIRAMRLAHAAHRSGILLSAADVFKSSTLFDMATVASRLPPLVASTRSDESRDSTIKLIQSRPFMASCRAQVADSEPTHLVGDNIEGIAEATDVQADMVAVGELDGEAWHNEFTIEATSGLNVSTLIQACESIIHHHRIFRTTFVQFGSALYQITVKEATLGNMITVEGPRTPVIDPVKWDTYFPRFHLSKLSDDGKICHKISLKIHHAHYDAISVDMVLHDLRRAYSGRALSTSPHFYDWLSHIHSANLAESKAYWKQALEGSSVTDLVSHSVPVTPHFCRDSIQFRVPLRNVTTAYGTPSSVVQAAWALVLSRATGRGDVVFCGPNANRSLPSFADVDRVSGMCLNFLPVRACLQSRMTLGSLIKQMHDQAVAGIPHQHLGFRSIISNCTDWPTYTRFGSMLIYQNHESLQRTISFQDQDCVLTPYGKFGRCADILVEATPSPSTWNKAKGQDEANELVIDILYSRRNFTEKQIEWISQFFAKVLQSITQNLEQPLERFDEHASIPYAKPSSSVPPKSSAGIARNTICYAKHVIDQAWDEVGLSQRDQAVDDGDCSMFYCGGDLVTALLLSRYYRRSGHNIGIQNIIDNPTRNGQMELVVRDEDNGSGL